MTSAQTDGAGIANRSHLLYVIAVNAYLLVVGTWLIATRQIPSPGFLRIGFALLKRPYSSAVQECVAESGHCYLAPPPEGLLSDRDSASALRLFEDGRELGPADASHSDIRQLGAGRHHSGRCLVRIYFSVNCVPAWFSTFVFRPSTWFGCHLPSPRYASCAHCRLTSRYTEPGSHIYIPSIEYYAHHRSFLMHILNHCIRVGLETLFPIVTIVTLFRK